MEKDCEIVPRLLLTPTGSRHGSRGHLIHLRRIVSVSDIVPTYACDYSSSQAPLASEVPL